MMKVDRQLDELFRSKLVDFEMKPPVYLWDQILEKQVAAKRRKRMLVWWISGTAASLLFAFLLGWELQQKLVGLKFENQVVYQENMMPNEEKGSTPVITDLMMPNKDSVDVMEDRESVHVRNSESREQAVSVKQQNDRVKVADVEREHKREALSDKMSLLQRMIVSLNSDWPQSSKLEAMNDSNSTLSDDDYRIMAMNKAKMIKETKGERSWIVGANVTPALNVNSAKYSSQYKAAMSSTGTNLDMSFGGGITVEMKTPRKWSVQSGIQYRRIAQNGTGSSSRDLYADVATAGDLVAAERTPTGDLVVNGPAGRVVLNSSSQNSAMSADFATAEGLNSTLMTRADFDQVFDYIEIPLLLRYQVLEGVLGVQLTAGVNSGFLVHNAVYSSGNNIGKTADMNNFSLSSSFGLGLGYKLLPRLQLRFEPQVRYFLQSLSDNSSIDYKPYSFGFSTGMSYSF